MNRGGLNHLLLYNEQPETKWTTTAESNLHERTSLMLCSLLESYFHEMVQAVGGYDAKNGADPRFLSSTGSQQWQDKDTSSGQVISVI